MEEKPSTARLALKWGGLVGLVEILVTTIRYALGYYSGMGGTLFGVLNGIIIVTGLVLALREFRSLNKGYMSVGEAVGLGSLMFTIMGLLDTTFAQFYQAFIDPNLIAKTLQQTRDFMEAQGVPDEALDKFDDQMGELEAQQRKKGASGGAFLLSILWWTFAGTIVTLIVSLFMRRRKDNPFD
ncbi:hypothetical protein FAES_4570 [Fibrella aestuarina BUZ 2]|uniref:DUF4199 domain-containing protein n=1 Tax=Fibrella aestuarina BUZ 2 TaxID=1166018 RepID=I0KEL6_9BACT|nr:DUF4199 domain-containing protein [Fibrella aestuarina]CCH02569.1 hypothetical protein FAES_4570 [Fibrella aestuarina BUZ 2]